PKDLLEPRWICPEIDRSRGQLSPEFEFLRLDFRLANIERISQKGVSIHNLKTKLHFTFANAGQVEKIVDYPRLKFDVATDELKRLAHTFRNFAVALERRD